MILKEPFLSAFKKVELLKKYDRYLGAFVFGSVARGDQGKDSDFDVIVIVNEDNDCKEINHPIVNGIKFDISFRSLQQIEKDNDDMVKKGDRVPMIAESIIVFDKNGDLSNLKNKYKKIRRAKATKKDFQFMQFMIYHSDNKAKRNLLSDKGSSLLALSININEILKFHYHLKGKWWLSNKRLLPDLRKWDPKLAKLVEEFVSTSNVSKKYKFWEQILNYVSKPMGGRKVISDINCNCEVCKKDLKLFA